MTCTLGKGLALAFPFLFCVGLSLQAVEGEDRTGSSAASACEDEPAEDEEEGWEKLTDGESFEGWKANENEETWSIEDGAFVAQGPRSHLFYVGPDHNFKNFELKVDVMTRPGSNGGIYFHTRWQDEGWPQRGYESQVNVTQGDPVKSGSLYNTVRLSKDDIDGIIKDNEWWTQHIIVRGKRVIVKLNGQQVIDYTEPEGKRGNVRLSEGTFALQGHDPGSTIFYKNIRVKRLPDDADAE